jgi:hypothetical protein
LKEENPKGEDISLFWEVSLLQEHFWTKVPFSSLLSDDGAAHNLTFAKIHDTWNVNIRNQEIFKFYVKVCNAILSMELNEPGENRCRNEFNHPIWEWDSLWLGFVGKIIDWSLLLKWGTYVAIPLKDLFIFKGAVIINFSREFMSYQQIGVLA